MDVKPIIIALTLTCSSSFSIADEYTSGSARHSGSLAESKRWNYEGDSNKVLEKIYSKFDNTNHIDAIKKHVETLRHYAKSACAVVGYSTGSGGAWPSTYALRCEAGIAYDHNFSLKNALTCLERVETKSFIFPGDKMNCIIQTLNTKLF